MERKLASIQRIAAIEIIEGADRIVKATVLGWNCVTQKSNNFKPGDLVAFFEIDSLLPLNNPSFAWLADPNKPGTHHRLKTKRFKKQIAQGLIIPLNDLKVGNIILLQNGTPFYANDDVDVADYHKFIDEGDDITEWLGITKYEPEIPAQLRGISKGQFPYFLVKTDETRIQSEPGVLTRRKGEAMYATEKLDGSSFSCWYYKNEGADQIGLPVSPEDKELGYTFGVASRNLNLARSDGNAFWVVADKYKLEDALKGYGRSLAIQGEMWGIGIQDNKLKSTTVNLSVFNVYDLETKTYLGRNDFLQVVADLGLTPVPTVFESFVLDHTVDQLVMMSIRKSIINPEVWAEGIVVRPITESVEKGLGRFSFKVINPEFLLKHSE